MNKFLLLIFLSCAIPIKSYSQIVDTNTEIVAKQDSSFSVVPTYSILSNENISTTQIDENKIVFRERNKNPLSNSHIFFGFIILFAIIIFVRLASPEYFRDLFIFAINGKYLLANYHKRNDILLINNILLDAVFIVIFTVLLFNLLSSIGLYDFEDILLGITICVVAQIVLVFVSYNIFFSSSVFNIHLTNLLIFNRVIGIILTPAVFITSYLNESYQLISLTLLIVLVVIIVIFRIFRVYLLIKRSYHFNSIYIILYLCIFEISLYLLFIREFSWIINLKL